MAVGLAVRKAATMNEIKTLQIVSSEPQPLTHLDMQLIQLMHSTNVNSSGNAARYLTQQMYSKGSAKLGESCSDPYLPRSPVGLEVICIQIGCINNDKRKAGFPYSALVST